MSEASEAFPARRRQGRIRKQSPIGLLDSISASCLHGNDYYIRSLLRNVDLDPEPDLLTSLTTEFLASRISRDGSAVAVGTGSGTLCVFRPGDCAVLSQTRICAMPVRDVCWVGDNLIAGGTGTGWIRLVEGNNNCIESSIMVSEVALVRSLSALPESQPNIIAWGCMDGRFGLADVRTQTKVAENTSRPHRLPGSKQAAVSSIVLTNSTRFGSNLVLTAGATDGTVKIWDSRNLSQCLGRIDRPLKNSFKGQGIVSLDLSSDNSQVLIARRGGTVSVQHIDSVLIKQPGLGGREYVLGSSTLDTVYATGRFSGDGSAIALSGDQGCVVFDPFRPEEALNLYTSSTASSCCWDKDGSVIATTIDGSLYRWNKSQKMVFRSTSSNPARSTSPFSVQDVTDVKRRRVQC